MHHQNTKIKFNCVQPAFNILYNQYQHRHAQRETLLRRKRCYFKFIHSPNSNCVHINKLCNCWRIAQTRNALKLETQSAQTDVIHQKVFARRRCRQQKKTSTLMCYWQPAIFYPVFSSLSAIGNTACTQNIKLRIYATRYTDNTIYVRGWKLRKQMIAALPVWMDPGVLNIPKRTCIIYKRVYQ